MNVFRQEVAFARTLSIVWAFVLIGLSLMYAAIYPTFAHDASAMRDVFAHIPEQVRAVLSIDVNAMLTFLGFFAITFTNLSLFGSIYAMYTGLSIFSREARNKTTDFLLTKPRTRSSIFIEKFLAGFTLVVIVWIVLTVVTFALAKIFGAGDFSVTRYFMMMAGLLMTQVWFYAAGIATSQLVGKVKAVISPTLTVTFGFFMVGVVGSIVGVHALRYLSPFKYVDYVQLATGHQYAASYLIAGAVGVVAFVIISWRRYVQRNERAV